MEVVEVTDTEWSDCEIVSISSEDEKRMFESTSNKDNLVSKRNTTILLDSYSHEKKTETLLFRKVNPVLKKPLSVKLESGQKSSNMTCNTIHPPRHKYSNKNKSWSKVKKEKEDQKCLPPPSKKAKISLLELTAAPNKTVSANGNQEDDYSSDDLPDLDNQAFPSLLGSSPIVLSSDEDSATPRLGLFASLTTGDSEGMSKPKLSSSNKEKRAKAMSLSSKLVFTQSMGKKMANLLGKVWKQKKPDGRPSSPSEYSDISGSSGSKNSSLDNRHFMDALNPPETTRPQSPLESLSDESKTSYVDLSDLEDSTCDSDNVDEDDVADDETYRPDSETSDTESIICVKSSQKNLFVPSPAKKPRLVNVNVKSKSVYKPVDIRRYFPQSPVKHFEKMSVEGRSSNLISYHCNFADETDELAAAMTHLHVNTVEAALEEGEQFLEYGLALIHDFSSHLKPTDSIVTDIINKSILGKSTPHVLYKSYKLLSNIWQKYPSSIFIDWSILSRVLSSLSLEKGLHICPTESVIRGSLYLQLVVQGLENDLKRRDLFNLVEIRRSLAHKLLSVETAYPNLKQVIYWVGHVITSEYKEMGCRKMPEGQASSSRPGQWSKICDKQVPKVLPNLQKLLQLGIQVSRNCVDASKRVANELVRTYMYLSDATCKKVFLQTMSSDLLRFKTTQKILEDYCDGTSFCCEDFPMSLRQVVESYYQASPPRSLVTPPQSPSDDEDFMPSAAAQYSSASCEELAMLVYINTQSYLQCAQKMDHEPLTQRCQDINQRKFPPLICHELQILHQAADDFHLHLLKMTSELSTATHTYLFMMKSLGSIH